MHEIRVDLAFESPVLPGPLTERKETHAKIH